MKGLKIFYYHLISESKKDYYPHKNTLEVNVFKEQIKYFSKHYEIITINEAYNRYHAGVKFDKQLVITTDDGFLENYTFVCPILDSYNVKGSFYLIENSIDNIQMMWRHILFVLRSKVDNNKLYEIIKLYSNEFGIAAPPENEDMLKWSYWSFPNKIKDQICSKLWDEVMSIPLDEYLNKNEIYLSSKQISEIIANGHSIGSHSKSHPNTELLSIEELDLEVNSSIKNLETKFSTDVYSFAFPFGRNEKASKIITDEFPDVRVQLGIMMKSNSNLGSPNSWERLNMETTSYKRKYFYEPLKNLLLHS